MALEMPEEVKQAIHQAWLPALMNTLLTGMKDIPQEHREALLTKMCTMCEDLAMVGAVGIQPGMSWDDYVAFLKGTVPPVGPWTVEQDGNVFDLYYDCSIGEDGKPQCHCPLVQLGLMMLDPYCCDSGARLAGRMIGGAKDTPVESVEVVDSAARTGAPICHYRVRLRS